MRKAILLSIPNPIPTEVTKGHNRQAYLIWMPYFPCASPTLIEQSISINVKFQLFKNYTIVNI